MYIIQSNNPRFNSTLLVFTSSTVMASNIRDAEVRINDLCTLHIPNSVLYI
jgi:hypothetical protein